MRVRIFKDNDALAEVAAEEVAAWLRLQEPPATLGLAGGSTPRATYQALLDQHVPWDSVHGWLTDERYVPPDHEASNGRMVEEALFGKIPATLHRVPYTEEQPHEAAEAYEREVSGLLRRGVTLDAGLVLLGIGTDGHTASLFPGTDALNDDHSGFAANWVEQQGSWRITATRSLLAKARRTMFLVTGEAKAATVAAILEGDSHLPAAVVSSAASDAVWLLDCGAASELRSLGD